MATLYEHDVSWHPGEEAVHRLLHVPHRGNPTSRGLPMPYAYRVADSPLVAFGALDSEGRPWTTVWGGERAFARPIAQGMLGVQSLVDRRYDPVVEALFCGKTDGEMIKPGQGSQASNEGVMAALSIDLESRDRVKLAGRMVAGAVASHGEDESESGNGAKTAKDGPVGEVQLAMLVQETLGNCPKYLNKKQITPHVPAPELISDTLPLPQAALDLIAKADLFFLSSSTPTSQGATMTTMDTNHRGGPPGFFRLASNSDDQDGGAGTVLVYPEYSGNRLYQTLGNLQTNPLIGIVVPDFDTSDALYLTGRAAILAGEDAGKILPHSRLAIRVTVSAARFVRGSLPFRGRFIDHSPYNPPVRPLAAEQSASSLAQAQTPLASATLVRREILTPTIARLTFRLQGSRALGRWRAGQHVTLDFGPELDAGWSHMRDDDPQSLNDDFIRTFTVSSVPPPPSPSGGGETAGGGDSDTLPDGAEMQLTVRKHGPATDLLWRQNLRVPLELSVLGFAGEEAFRLPIGGHTGAGGEEGGAAAEEMAIFVAAGVGITPLLAQAPGVLEGADAGGGSPLRLLWSLRVEDVPLAADTFRGIPGLAERTRLFVTGGGGSRGGSAAAAVEKAVKEVEEMGCAVVKGRMGREDVLMLRDDGGSTGGEGKGKRKRKYYLCTNPAMLKSLMEWLEGEEVVTESFNY